MGMTLGEAFTQISTLRTALSKIVERDPEQEVKGMAVPVLDTVLREARHVLPPENAVLAQIQDIISPENVEAGEPIRAVDMLLVVNAIYSALAGPYARW